MDWEPGVSRCKLFYREGINNKVLLNDTGNYVQYPKINHNRKKNIKWNHFALQLKLTH